MPERISVPFLPPTPDVRPTGEPRGRARPTGPGAAEQQQRLGPVFERLRVGLEAERVRVTNQPEAIAPEHVLVMEIAGEMDEFLAAVTKVPGLEYLAEELGEKLDDTSLFASVDKDQKRTPLRRELFVVASDERAARELESLWKTWQSGKKLKYGWRSWSTVFERLLAVRPWDDSDRLSRTGAADVWRADLRDAGDELIPFEIELWFRRSASRRDAERAQVAADLERSGGQALGEFVLEEIGYHGILAELPAGVLLQTAETMNVAWLSGRGVRFLRASGQTSVPLVDEPETAEVAASAPVGGTDRSPRIALLDGLPLARHELLTGGVMIDDPDGWEETVEAKHRRHGTGMASAILRGDLASGEPPLNEPIYVRPIIRVDPRYDWVDDAEETIPVHRLPVEVVHEAVVRMKEGPDAQAPDVRVINVSVGDRAQQFDRFVSPWARLLDYLSARYEVLFVVSAGNHPVDVVLPPGVDLSNAAELEAEVLAALAETASFRRVLAPGESVNAVTVGAAHEDSGTIPDDGRVNPIVSRGVPAPLTSWGPGHGRAITPDVLAPGGRQLLDLQPRGSDAPQILVPSRVRRSPGIQVATPGGFGALNATTWTHGTSPATALTTRAAGLLLQRLDALRAEWGSDMPGPEFDAVLLKALLVHGARWGDGEAPMRRAIAAATGAVTKDDLGRALGYGGIRPNWTLVDDDHRVTALYASRLGDGIHNYQLPLPPSLAGRTDRRRVTVTLAWLTPVNPAHRLYRRVKLNVEARGSVALAPTRQEADNRAVGRGTAQHEILEGKDAVPYIDGTDLAFTITGSAAAGPVDQPVPYAFVVTLETAEPVGLPIYAEVRTRLRARAARIRV